MSSLAERLAAARRQAEQAAQGDSTTSQDPAGAAVPTEPRRVAPPPTPAPRRTPDRPRGYAASAQANSGGEAAEGRRRQAPKTAEPTSRRRGGSTEQERLDELKGHVHTELVKQLGPHLYAADVDQADLESRVRQVLADVLSRQDRPISNADRARVTQEISDDILGYGPIEPFLRDVGRLRGHGQRLRPDLPGEGRPAPAGEGPVHRRGPPAPHDRQDRVPHRPPRRRVQPDGRRSPPRRQPRQRGHPAAGDRRLLPDHPQVRRPTR